MKKSSFLIILFMIYNLSKAQEFSSEVFHEGYCVVKELDTIVSSFQYDFDENIIKSFKEKKPLIITCKNLIYLEIKDAIEEKSRKFYSIPYKTDGDYEAPILFELLHEGDVLSLLSRERVEYINTPGLLWNVFYMKKEIVYSFYFFDKKGRIKLFSGRKKDLWQNIMRKYASKIKSYIKDNKLNINNIDDMVNIVLYYNSL